MKNATDVLKLQFQKSMDVRGLCDFFFGSIREKISSSHRRITLASRGKRCIGSRVTLTIYVIRISSSFDNELYFDYKLKKGICQNMNASFLLKKMNVLYNQKKGIIEFFELCII